MRSRSERRNWWRGCSAATRVDYADQLRVDNSPIDGLGVFARVELVPPLSFVYKGELLDQGQAADRYCWFPTGRDRADFGFFVPPRFAVDHGNSKLYTDASNGAMANEMRYVNHRANKQANCKLVANPTTHVVTIRVDKKIKAGTELTMSYGPSFKAMSGMFPPLIKNAERLRAERRQVLRRRRRRELKLARRLIRHQFHLRAGEAAAFERRRRRERGEAVDSPPSESSTDLGSDALTPREIADSAAKMARYEEAMKGKYAALVLASDDEDAASQLAFCRQVSDTLAYVPLDGRQPDAEQVRTALGGSTGGRPVSPHSADVNMAGCRFRCRGMARRNPSPQPP